MARYEMVREILNACPNNQMRDVFFSEVETDDPEAFVLSALRGGCIITERSELSDGSTVIRTDCSGLIQVYTFTPDE